MDQRGTTGDEVTEEMRPQPESEADSQTSVSTDGEGREHCSEKQRMCHWSLGHGHALLETDRARDSDVIQIDHQGTEQRTHQYAVGLGCTLRSR
jgi:hypothetical protein